MERLGGITQRQLIRSAVTLVLAFVVVTVLAGPHRASAAPPAPAPGDPAATTCDKVLPSFVAGACNNVVGAVPGGQAANQAGGQAIADAQQGAQQVAGVVTAPIQAAGTAISVATDPLGYFAQQVTKSVTGLTSDLQAELDKTTGVPLNQPSTFDLYSKVWAVGLVLTVGLWLWGLAMRVARGQPVTKMVGETFGTLVLSYVAAMIALPVVVLLVQAGDAATAGISGGLGANMGTIAGKVVPAWTTR